MSSGALGLQTVPAAGLGPTLGSLHQPFELALHFRPFPEGARSRKLGWCRHWAHQTHGDAAPDSTRSSTADDRELPNPPKTPKKKQDQIRSHSCALPG